MPTSVVSAGKYSGLAYRAKVFTAGTAVTGVAPGTAIGTTGAFTLANLAASVVDLVVLRTTMGYVSGTLGAGVVHYLANINPAAAAVTGTAITAVTTRLGSTLVAAGKPFTTSTLPATPLVMRSFCSLEASLATTAIAPWQIIEDVDGEFVIAPGCSLTLHATAAGGSSPLVVFGMTWAEITRVSTIL